MAETNEANKSFAGFEVVGNVQSVLHGVIPSNPAQRGPIETGVFTFQIASHNLLNGTPSEEFFYNIESNTGDFYSKDGAGYSAYVTVSNGIGYIPVINPPAGSGTQPATIYVLLYNNENTTLNRAIVGNFRLNGVELQGSVLNDIAVCNSSD